MDEWMLERAEQLAQQARDRGRVAANEALQPQSHPDFDGLHCVDCGIELHVVRLQMRRVRCTECQSLREKKR